MSWRVTAWALKQRTGDPVLKLLLLALASYVDDKTWEAWPSQATLAADTEQSVDTVQRQLKLLQNRSLISVDRRQKRTGHGLGNVYRLPCDRPHSSAAYNGRTVLRPINDGHRPHSSAVHIGRKTGSIGRTAMRHDPSLDPSSERLEPSSEKSEGEKEPSPSAVPQPARSRQEEAQRLAEERKNRPTEEELRKRYSDHPILGKKFWKSV